MLQVAIGDVAVGVVGGHQPGLDSRRERLPPEVTVSFGVVVDATHASLRSISSAQELGGLPAVARDETQSRRTEMVLDEGSRAVPAPGARPPLLRLVLDAVEFGLALHVTVWWV